MIERQQLVDEGRDLTTVAAEFDALTLMDIETNPEDQTCANALLDRTIKLPMRNDYTFAEPSDLAGIRDARSENRWRAPQTVSDDALFDKVLGAWLGRTAGCLLGKPVEGWRSARLWGYLQDLGRFPLDRYITSDAPAEIVDKYQISRDRAFIDRVSRMTEDDDLNYTVTGLAILKQHGVNFTPLDVATFWMQNLPLLRTYTAERVAYRNFCRLIAPPKSAQYRNPYREWIGAQIRADFWGYAALRNPELAAELAWRDASVSHIKNGIYGEMWIAAMLAAAPFLQDPREVIEIGLAEIPQQSRLASDVHEVIGWYTDRMTYEDAARRIHQRWDESNPHHWTHTNSNAQIVAVGLLWGDGDFARSICRAVQVCFDTDCNGATVGSIVGMMRGAKQLADEWIRPLNDTLETCVRGFGVRRISELAREGFELYRAIREQPR